MAIIKRYEITDAFDGRSLLIIPRCSTRRTAKKFAQSYVEDHKEAITLHELGRYGARTLLENYDPKG